MVRGPAEQSPDAMRNVEEIDHLSDIVEDRTPKPAERAER
jgi:hypothetical protein